MVEPKSRIRKSLAGPLVAALMLAGLPAFAADLPMPASPLPTFAQSPAPATNPWTGFTVGTSVFGSFGKGGHGFGGGVDAGYTHAFDNHLVLGVGASAGYMPVSFGNSNVKGFDVAATNVKVGYDLGRIMPFVTTGVVLAKPALESGPDYVNAADSVNDLFNSKGDTKALATIGAGVDVAVTDRLRFGVSASVGTGHGLAPPPGW